MPADFECGADPALTSTAFSSSTAQYNSFITVSEEQALEQAKAADEIAAGNATTDRYSVGLTKISSAPKACKPAAVPKCWITLSPLMNPP